MHHALERGWRIIGFLAVSIVIAHCGDGNNNGNGNDNTGPRPSRTPTGVVRTATPGGGPTATAGGGPTSTAGGGATPTAGGTGATATPGPSGSGGGTPTVAPTGNASTCPHAISVVGNEATTELDTGWTGLAHGSKIISGSEVTVMTDCGGNARPCGTCNVTGPIANPDAGAGVSNNHRCSNDTSTECTDDSGCSGGSCVFFFGPPLPLSAGGVSTCVTNQIVGSITGTANIETGEGASTVQLTSRVFSGPVLDQPCPICSGDATPADGQKGGSCVGGPKNGSPCDVAGTSPTFAPKGSTSFDCPPDAGGQIGALPINLSNSTSSVTKTLAANNPDCGGLPGSKCFCDTCTTAASEPCSTNADCPTGSQCGGRRCRGGPNNGKACAVSSECTPGACSGLGQATQPNACDNGTTCSPVGGGNAGECSGGPVDTFCQPHDTFRSCTSNGECTFAGDACTGTRNRPCFLDNGTVGGSVTATGHAEVPSNGISHPTLAALFCIPPTTAPAVNTAAGLPGLGRLQLNSTATERP